MEKSRVGDKAGTVIQALVPTGGQTHQPVSQYRTPNRPSRKDNPLNTVLGNQRASSQKIKKI